MTKTEELSKVLDMPEEEQADWFKNNGYKEYVCVDIKSFTQKLKFNALFADLAFRLRNEVVEDKSFMWTCAKVYNKAWKYKIEPHEIDAPTVAMWIWFATQAKPIHWIIAALLAKETAK